MGDDSLLSRFGRAFPRGTILFREGDAGREMYVVQVGRVTISKKVADFETILSTLGAGEFFGEMSILCGRPRSATATVAEDASLLVIDSRTFETMVRSHAEVALLMIKKLAERLQAADDQISNLLLRDESSRVVNFLVTAAERQARGVAGPVKLALRREELPALAGASPAQVEGVLERLTRTRLVSLDPDGVVVPDVGKLRNFLDFLKLRAEFGDAP
jgi:CRP/FNR family transcriptional regulator, cyclic AMP receptor protein